LSDQSPPTAPTTAIPVVSTRGLSEDMVRTVVDRFYAKAREDELVGPVFKAAVPDERWQAHLDTIVDFWSSVLLGTRRYDGRPLRKHLMLPELQDAQFRRWLALFRQTVEKVCPPDLAAFWVDRSERIGNSFRISVRMHNGDDVTSLRPLERELLP
jgi:hemoglobin